MAAFMVFFILAHRSGRCAHCLVRVAGAQVSASKDNSNGAFDVGDGDCHAQCPQGESAQEPKAL